MKFDASTVLVIMLILAAVWFLISLELNSRRNSQSPPLESPKPIGEVGGNAAASPESLNVISRKRRRR